MYPTVECECRNEWDREDSCVLDPMPKPGDILEHADGERQLIRHHTIEHMEKWVGGDCYRPLIQHFILIDGEPTKVIASGGVVVFTSTLEALHEWPPTNSKLIRDGIVIFDSTAPDPHPTAA